MKYVIQIDFQTSGQYYLSFEYALKKIREIYNPYFATAYSSKEKAQEDIDAYMTDMTDYLKIISREEVCKKWDEWFASGMQRREFSFADYEVSYPYDKKKHSPLDVLKFRVNYYSNSDKIKSEHYRTWPPLYNVYKNIFNYCQYYNEINNDLFYSFELRVDRNADFSSFKEELNLILDYCTRIEDGYKVFKIFDHELSEFTSRSFYYKNDDDCYISEGRYTQYTTVSGNLEKVFQVWRDNFYY